MSKGEWGKTFWAKALAFALAVILVNVAAANIAALLFSFEGGWWSSEPDIMEHDLVTEAIYERMSDTLASYDASTGTENMGKWYIDPSMTNYRFAIYDEAGEKIFDNITSDGRAVGISAPLYDGKGHIESGVANELTAQDGIFWTVKLLENMYRIFRYSIPVLGACLLLLIFITVYLARVSGRQPAVDAPVPGWQEKIPFDVYLALIGLGLFGLGAIASDAGRFVVFGDLPLYILLYTGCIAGAAILFTALWMTFCARLKIGGWWRNTVIFQALRLLLFLIKWLFRGIKAFGRGTRALFRGIPLIWKTFLGVAAVIVYEIIALAVGFGGNASGASITMWFIEKILLVPLVIVTALQLRKLQAGGKALAAGETDARIDTSRMLPDLRKHGDDLNDISRGMQRAVDQQLRSERLKTELITNVSHDIKTPLTSIINYVDLLKKELEAAPVGEKADGETPDHTAEYLDVLDRQSRRLKKLTEDLVEMSKASTGNIPVNASRRSVNELLSQAAGEYVEKLEKAELEAVVTLPEPEAFMMADGTLVWRILDNIFSNACKYALPGTRFYISASREPGRVVMSFKNVSREKLNISAEELMERFVRGDSARSGEGSGLGLNIAKSLAELQGGSLSLSIDGDLFKADVSLPSAE